MIFEFNINKNSLKKEKIIEICQNKEYTYFNDKSNNIRGMIKCNHSQKSENSRIREHVIHCYNFLKFNYVTKEKYNNFKKIINNKNNET